MSAKNQFQGLLYLKVKPEKSARKSPSISFMTLIMKISANLITVSKFPKKGA